MPFLFKAVWTKGSEHSIPDALSRAPVGVPNRDDVKLDEELAQAMCATIFINVVSISPAQVEAQGQAATMHNQWGDCLLYTSPSPRDRQKARMPSSA